MTLSSAVKAMLQTCGKLKGDLGEYFGMSKQSMANKMKNERWSGKDLVRAADFCGCRVAIICPDGSQIMLDAPQVDGAEE